MASKSRTRFAVIVDQEPRALFSVLQRANGDLLLIMKFADNMESAVGDQQQVHQHFSIHRSRKSTSGGYAVKETVRLAGGQTLDWYQFRKPINGRYATIVHAKTMPTLANPKYLLNANSKDRVAMLSPDDFGPATLYLTIIASDYEMPMVPFGLVGMGVTQAQFRHSMHLSVAFGAFMLPNLSGGTTLRPVTSAVRVNEGETQQFTLSTLRGYTDEELVDGCVSMRRQLFEETAKRHRAFIELNRDELGSDGAADLEALLVENSDMIGHSTIPFIEM